jgi:hypothetical protein
MFISLNGIWLTNANDGTSERLVTSTRGLAINGKVLVQEGDLLRAIAAAFFARGNLSHNITFKVTRRFTTLAAAFSFAATYRSLLPTEGPLVMVCGLRSETQIICNADDAVLEDCNYTVDDTPGVSITHSYSIRCGEITSAGVPAILTYEGGNAAADYTNASVTTMIDGGNFADTYINCPTFDGGGA